MFRLISPIGIVMAAYAGFALLGPVFGAADFRMTAFLANIVWRLPLPSGADWPVELGALFPFAGLAALGFGMLRRARGSRSRGACALAILWPLGGAALFLLVGPFATSVFLLLIALALFDAIAGLPGPWRRARPAAGTPAAEPRSEAPPLPPAER